MVKFQNTTSGIVEKKKKILKATFLNPKSTNPSPYVKCKNLTIKTAITSPPKLTILKIPNFCQRLVLVFLYLKVQKLFRKKLLIMAISAENPLEVAGGKPK